MKETLTILLDVERVRVLSAAGVVLADVPWDPDAPGQAAASLRPALSNASRGTIVVGLGLLEIARPELPPLPPAQRRALLLRDADRYFPVADRVGVSWADGFGFAVEARRLLAWVGAFEKFCAIAATTTVVECMARGGANGSWILPAGEGETGRVTVASGVLREVRRVPIAIPALSDGEAPERARNVDLGAIARGAALVADAPLDVMLMDDGLARRFSGARRMRWVRSIVALLVATAALAWSGDRWRERQLDAADARLLELTASAEPAIRAEARLQRARSEAGLLRSSGSSEAGAVLERLAALMPRDAFIQRLEWDGSVWRIDGSASNAPRIVPLLDGDPRLTDVRIVAASTRFMDAGRQRESFSISFRTTVPGAVANAR